MTENGNGIFNIFKVKNSLLKFFQLFSPIIKVIHCLILINDILFTSCRNVYHNHSVFNPSFKVNIFIQVHIWPEIN